LSKLNDDDDDDDDDDDNDERTDPSDIGKCILAQISYIE